MTLGEQIRRAREAKNLSQEALAEYLGVSRQAVSKWENGTAVPQGANMAALIEILELDAKKEEPATQNRGIASWLGWVVSTLLLLALVITAIFWGITGPGGTGSVSDVPEPSTTPVETLPPGETEEKPELMSVRFYSSTQEEVPSVSEHISKHNTAGVESILIQWTGSTPLENAKMFFLPNTATNPSEAELLEVKQPHKGENALLFSASYLHNENRRGSVYFELCFTDGYTVSSEENYQVYFSHLPAQLVYVYAFADERLTFDKVEWVNEGTARAEELGIENTNNGMELYNEQTILQTLPVSKDAPFIMMIWNHPEGLMVDSKETFLEHMDNFEYPLLCELVIEDGVVTSLKQRYTP